MKSILTRVVLFTVIGYLVLSQVTGYSIRSVCRDFVESDFIADTFMGDLFSSQDRVLESVASDTPGATGLERPDKEVIAKTIEEYFVKCNERNFGYAYELFSRGYKKRVSYADYYTKVAIFYGKALRLKINVAAANSKMAGAEVTALLQDQQGFRETCWHGHIMLVFEKRRWRIESINLEQAHSGVCD